MGIILLLAAATVASRYGVADVSNETKGFFVRDDALNSINGQPLVLKEIAAKLTDYKPRLNESTFEASSERIETRMLYQSDIALTKRKAEQMFRSFSSSSRMKRHVLKDNPQLNRTWHDGVFYTFNTTGQF
uniref:Inhibitor_I29 domain-containing protein n=1 Tax=Angiostrongylus cantonensis TaxID=6313 RepID=A0A0K0D1Y3_ANGCA